MKLIEQFRVDFEEHLAEYRSQLPKEPANLYDAIHHILDGAAKRLRPVSVLLGYYLFKDDYKSALPLALSIEIFHNFTLVHDDIMDSAALRRGRPTVHKKYGTNTAIMVGDVMLIHAFRTLLALDEHIHLDLILDYYTDIGSRICEGQIYDMDFEKREDINRDEYMNMVGLKTAVLLGLAFQTGAMAAGKDENESEYLFEFGYALGLAFQIMDDWLDAFGDETTTGKKRGGDIRQRKKTWPWIMAMDEAGEEDRTFLKSVIRADSVSDSEVNRVLNLYRLYHVDQLVKNFAENLLAEVTQKIKKSDLSEDKTGLLVSLADQLVKRQK